MDYIYNTTGYSETNALSLEASIQRSVEEELYSSLEVWSSCNEYTHFLIGIKFFVFVSASLLRHVIFEIQALHMLS
jgi:hypothetical protein